MITDELIESTLAAIVSEMTTKHQSDEPHVPATCVYCQAHRAVRESPQCQLGLLQVAVGAVNPLALLTTMLLVGLRIGKAQAMDEMVQISDPEER